MNGKDEIFDTHEDALELASKFEAPMRMFSASDEIIERNWLALAMAGDFSTMPVPFTWDQSAAFAHIIDGYGIAGGVSECMQITRNAIDSEPDPHDGAGSAMQLWVALFGKHRSYRHGGYPPGPRDRLYLDMLCEALRRRLQILGFDDRKRLLAVMAEHPGFEVSSSSQTARQKQRGSRLRLRSDGQDR
jgi:hypothetical protein